MATNGNGFMLALLLTAVVIVEGQEDIPVLRSCSELKLAGYSNHGDYTIDPDGPGIGLPPFRVYCDIKVNGCAIAERQTCNCDANDLVWRTDNGYLTDKTTLPVIELRFGDTGHYTEKVEYQLGPLKCWGIGQDSFPSCNAWTAAGYIGEGDYLIQPSTGPAEVRRCNEEHLPSPPPILRSCEELRAAGYTANDEYWIDPDYTSVGLQPFLVFCDMATGTTIVRNDQQGPLISQGFEYKGEHRIVVFYNGAPIQQVSNLVDISDTCKQYMSKECHYSFTWSPDCVHSEYTWWISRNGTHMSNWGSPTGTEGCACSVNARCNRPLRMCNCDTNDDVWRQDDGYITDKATLPIRELRIGGTSTTNRVAIYSVGELKCEGIAVSVPDVTQEVLAESTTANYTPSKNSQGSQETGGTQCPQDSSVKQNSPVHWQLQLNRSQRGLHFVVAGVIILLIAVVVVIIIAVMQWKKIKKLESIINMTNLRGQNEKDVPEIPTMFSHVRFDNVYESDDKPAQAQASLI